MVRRFKKTTTFFVLGIVALLALGVGYAQWTDQLDVDGTVNTAQMNVRWSDHTVVETVGSGVGCTINLDNNGKLANLTMNNAYPGAECKYSANIYNNGGVPVEVTTQTYDVDGTPQGDPWDTDLLFLNDTCIGQTISIPAGDKHLCEVRVTVQNGAQQGSSHGFSATFDAAVDS